MAYHTIFKIIGPWLLILFSRTVLARESKIVAQFRDRFQERIYANQSEFKFSVEGLSAKETADEYSKLILGHTDDPAVANRVVEIIHRAVMDSYDKFTPAFIIKFSGTSAAEILQLFGKLNQRNTLKLANTFARDEIRSLAKADQNDPKSRIEANIKAFGKFTQNQGLLSEENVPVLGTVFANAMYNEYDDAYTT